MIALKARRIKRVIAGLAMVLILSGCAGTGSDELETAQAAQETAEAEVETLQGRIEELEAEVSTLKAELEAAATTTTSTTTPVTTTTLADVSLDEDDFMIDLIILENKCFNTAGALVTVEPELVVSDLDSFLASGNEYTIVYEVHGGEAVNTYNLSLDSDGNYTYDQETISTASCDFELVAEVVRVLQR